MAESIVTTRFNDGESNEFVNHSLHIHRRDTGEVIHANTFISERQNHASIYAHGKDGELVMVSFDRDDALRLVQLFSTVI